MFSRHLTTNKRRGLFALFCLMLACANAASAARIELHVSPDGPLPTLEAARDALRQARRTNPDAAGEGALIVVHPGVYEMSRALTLDARDGGSSKNAPVIWRAAMAPDAQDEANRVILRGGRAIGTWTPVRDAAALARIPESARAHVRVADLRAEGVTDFGAIAQRGNPGLELFWRGARQPLARYPNTGWLLIADVPQTGAKRYNEGLEREKRFDGVPAGRHYGRFTCAEERPAHWAADDQIYAHGYWTWDWSDSFQRVARIDPATREVTLAEPHHNYGYTRNQRYYFLNVLEELDRPGEWYLDRARGLLYFYPPQAQLAPGDVIVSVLEEPFIQIDGASDLALEGFVIEQGRGSGIVVNGGARVTLAGHTLRNLGGEAVVITGGARHTVASCNLHDLANGAIRVEGGDRATLTPSGHEIVNNHIHRFSQWLRTGEYGVLFTGVGHRIAHNYIHDAPFEGLRLAGNDHLVEYNELCRLTQETGDAGAMHTGRDYTWRGNVFRYNYWHHMQGPGLHGATSYYLDDFASGFVLYGNLFYKAGRAVQIGGGRDNTVANNLFIECAPAIHLDARGLGWASNYFDGRYPWLFERFAELDATNPPYSTRYPALRTLIGDQPPVPKGNRIVGNISWGGGRWADFYDFWAYDFHAEIEMRDNIIADTHFVRRRAKPEKTWDPYYLNIDGKEGYQLTRTDDPATRAEFAGNFFESKAPGTFDPLTLRFTPANPDLLRRIGWRPLPVEKMGLQKDAWRKTLPPRAAD